VKRSLSLLAVLLLLPAPARADDGQAVDASHGRLDGDLAVVPSLGATLGPRAPRATVDMRFRYLSTAGIFATYEQGPPIWSAAEPRRALALGVEVRPLFLARWATGREAGNPRLDLLIDSIGIEVGAVFLQPNGSRFGSRPGLEVGLGAELPIFPKASGPFIGARGGVRWSDAALSGGPLDGPSDRSLYLAIVIGWQQLFGGHVVDLGDRPR
jgi:hypothetical protein